MARALHTNCKQMDTPVPADGTSSVKWKPLSLWNLISRLGAPTD